ncbi:hypothetical protein SBADM41S_09239 [Streptomyces badius]
MVINCRPDRVERNGQMGEIIPDLQPDNVFVIGHPAKSAIDAIPADWQDRAVDLGGEKRAADEFMPAMLGRMSDGASLVAIGNIHGQGEELLEYLAELPADESEADEETPNPVAANPAQASRLDPFASYHPAYEERYQASQTQEIPVVRIPAQPTDSYRPQPQPQQHEQYARQERYGQRESHAQQEPYAPREPYPPQDPGQNQIQGEGQGQGHHQGPVQNQGQGQGRRQQDHPFEFFADAPRKQPYEPAPHIWPPHDEPHDDARRSR